MAHLMLNEWEPAEDCLREALRLDPFTFRAYDHLGVLLANQGRHEEAEAMWEGMIAAARARMEKRARVFDGYLRARIGEAEERLNTLSSPDFEGFPLDFGYEEGAGSVSGSA